MIGIPLENDGEKVCSVFPAKLPCYEWHSVLPLFILGDLNEYFFTWSVFVFLIMLNVTDSMIKTGVKSYVFIQKAYVPMVFKIIQFVFSLTYNVYILCGL